LLLRLLPELKSVLVETLGFGLGLFLDTQALLTYLLKLL